MSTIKDINNNVYTTFLALVQAGLWEKDVELRGNGTTDFDEIMRLAEEQSVVGLVTAGLEHVTDVKVPQEWLLQFIGQSLQIEQQNRDMNVFVAMLIDKLRKEDVYAILVKGQGVAQCYERPLWRCSGDVDLFLSDDNYNKAKELLLPKATNVEKEEKFSKHLGMTIDGWCVELHGTLRNGLSRKVVKELDEIQNDTFYGGYVRSWDNNGVQIFLLKAENDIVYVFTHFLRHFYKGGIGLRQICDWTRLIWTYKDKIDSRLLKSRIQKMGLMTEWKTFAAVAVEYLGMPAEAMPFYEESARWSKKAKRIVDFILVSGNFGHNRDMSYYSKYPFVVRKTISMGRRIADMFKHSRIFPIDSLRFTSYIMWNGLRSAVRGEG